MITKKCIRCNRILKTSEFYIHKTTKDRLRPYCKTCMIDLKKPWHATKKIKKCSVCKHAYPRVRLLTTSHGLVCYHCFTKKAGRV